MRFGTIIFLFLVLVFACEHSCFSQETLKDIDGNIYPTTKIGNQLWMAKNLMVSHYNNGDTIHSYCYNHDTSYCRVYGRLYPWRSIVGGNNSDSVFSVCPDNWHIPTDEEWEILIDTLGGMQYAGIKLRKEFDTQFNIQWGGNYQSELDIFSFNNSNVYFWSSTKYSKSAAWMRMTGTNMKNVNRSTAPQEFAFSVRCIKD